MFHQLDQLSMNFFYTILRNFVRFVNRYRILMKQILRYRKFLLSYWKKKKIGDKHTI